MQTRYRRRRLAFSQAIPLRKPPIVPVPLSSNVLTPTILQPGATPRISERPSPAALIGVLICSQPGFANGESGSAVLAPAVTRYEGEKTPAGTLFTVSAKGCAALAA